MEEQRKELEKLLKERKEVEARVKELAYLVYNEEEGCELDGLPVKVHGYKKVLRRLGYVI